MNDPNWADQLVAWGTLGYTALTLGIVVAAGVAAYYTRKQLHQAEETAVKALAESRSARVDAVRPVLVFTKANLVQPAAGRPERAIRVFLENVGAGPALDVEVAWWVEPIPPGIEPARLALWNQEVQKAERSVTSRPKDGLIRVIAIGAGGGAKPFLIDDQNQPYLDRLSSRDEAFVFLAVKCLDLHGQPFFAYPLPSGPGKLKFVRRQAILDPNDVFEPL